MSDNSFLFRFAGAESTWSSARRARARRHNKYRPQQSPPWQRATDLVFPDGEFGDGVGNYRRVVTKQSGLFIRLSSRSIPDIVERQDAAGEAAEQLLTASVGAPAGDDLQQMPRHESDGCSV
ncbi:unnamed protein product [Cuscuta europaea]|uniref:Uncharacterized protein n=1 Tax=Cuscuta europaea TaxID=41803 RepID=A0A9P0ZK94_CUSEU|nr:unnamed protein product [Cuscuta europaea]